MVKVLDYLDIPTKLKLASLNSRMRRRIYQDCSRTWETIDFVRFCRYAVRQRLADADLARLLTDVSARSITKKLNLCHCRLIGGAGLEPLRESRVLETVLLEETHADIDSQNLALWHLSNSIQHKLGQVIFSENAMSRGGNFLKLFFRILRQTKLLRARKDQTRYTSCQVIVVDQARQVVSSANGPPDFSCSKCNNIYCRKGSCAMSVRECHYSGQTLCADCDPLEQCDQCGKTPCDKCNEIPI